ncbi:MAG: hypothetical protein ABF649_10180 [Bacillus sp. (in: firmicutes)]
MNLFQHMIAIIKEDINTDNSEILSLFHKYLNTLFSLIMIISIPFLITLLLQL